MSSLPPGIIAYGDQLRATLADLVAYKRHHDREEGCSYPDLCIGKEIEVEPGHVGFALDLLRIAIVELANSSYHTLTQHQEGE